MDRAAGTVFSPSHPWLATSPWSALSSSASWHQGFLGSFIVGGRVPSWPWSHMGRSLQGYGNQVR